MTNHGHELEHNSVLNFRITLIIKDRDSSSTYYRLSQGLKRPDSPETMSKKKEEESSKKQIETEVLKNKKLMFAKANR